MKLYTLNNSKNQPLAEVIVEHSNSLPVTGNVYITNYSNFLLGSKHDKNEIIEAFEFIDDIQVFYMQKIKTNKNSEEIIKNVLRLIANYFGLKLSEESDK